jgi:hypothetical protein
VKQQLQPLMFWIVLSGLLTLFLSVLVIFKLVLYPQTVLEVASPVQILTPRVIAGEGLGWKFDYCKSEDVSANLRLSLMSSEMRAGKRYVTVVPLNYMVGALPEGCATAISWVEVPPVTPPGRYWLRVDHEYWKNTLTMIRYRYDTPAFEVVSK